MTRSLTLSIPKPCAQKWSSFTPAGGGGFCSACNKVVVDFTKLSDQDIIEYFLDNPTKTCGRFHPDQLKTFTLRQPVKVKPGWMLLKAGLISFLMMVVSKPSIAQQAGNTQTEWSVNKTSADTTGHNFKGVVFAKEDHSALPGVNVVLKGTPYGTATDAEGRFEFPRKVKDGDVLIFSFIGLITKEFKVNGKRDAGYEVPMELCMDMDMTGEVQIEGLYTEKKSRTLWTRVKELFQP